MSDQESGGNTGNDSCQVYQDYADIISDQRDECNSAGCAAASDFSAAAAYYAASACYSKK